MECADNQSKRLMKPEPEFILNPAGYIMYDAATPRRTGVWTGMFMDAPNHDQMDAYVCMACHVDLHEGDEILYHTENPDTVFHVSCIEAICEVADPNWLDAQFEKLRAELIEKYEK